MAHALILEKNFSCTQFQQCFRIPKKSKFAKWTEAHMPLD